MGLHTRRQHFIVTAMSLSVTMFVYYKETVIKVSLFSSVKSFTAMDYFSVNMPVTHTLYTFTDFLLYASGSFCYYLHVCS
jgi:hypothetical protein